MTCHCNLTVGALSLHSQQHLALVLNLGYTGGWAGCSHRHIAPGRAAYNNSNNKGAANIPAAIVQHQTLPTGSPGGTLTLHALRHDKNTLTL